MNMLVRTSFDLDWRVLGRKVTYYLNGLNVGSDEEGRNVVVKQLISRGSVNILRIPPHWKADRLVLSLPPSLDFAQHLLHLSEGGTFSLKVGYPGLEMSASKFVWVGGVSTAPELVLTWNARPISSQSDGTTYAVDYFLNGKTTGEGELGLKRAMDNAVTRPRGSRLLIYPFLLKPCLQGGRLPPPGNGLDDNHQTKIDFATAGIDSIRILQYEELLKQRGIDCVCMITPSRSAQATVDRWLSHGANKWCLEELLPLGIQLGAYPTEVKAHDGTTWIQDVYPPKDIASNASSAVVAPPRWISYVPCRSSLQTFSPAQAGLEMRYFLSEGATLSGCLRGVIGIQSMGIRLGAEGLTRHVKILLYFCEPNKNAKPGDRVFTVRIAGKPVLKDLDIVAETGNAYVPLVKEIENIKVRGTLRLDFEATHGKSVLCAVKMVDQDNTAFPDVIDAAQQSGGLPRRSQNGY